MIAAKQAPSRRAFVLLLTLLSLVTLCAAVAGIAGQSAVETIRIVQKINGVQHELAVDSAIRRLAVELATDDRIIDELDRWARTTRSWTLGQCAIDLLITDDAAKLPVHLYARPADRRLLARKFEQLAGRFNLPNADVRLTPIAAQARGEIDRYESLDQLLHDVSPGAYFHDSLEAAAQQRVWSDVLTLHGTPRIDVRRADEALLDVALGDVQRHLGRTILTHRSARDPATNFLAEALAALPGDVRDKVAPRLAFDLKRYAVTVATRMGNDRRMSYIVVTIDKYNVNLHYKGQVTW